MSVITAITAQQRNKSRVNLYLDNEFALGLDAAAAIAAGLKAGMEISAGELKEIALSSDVNCAFEKAVKLLSVRPRSEKEISVYFREKGYGEEVSALARERLKIYGYIDDTAFAEAFVKSYGHKYGKSYIDYRLKEAGIPHEIRRGALDYSDTESAEGVARKYLRSHPNADRRKLRTFLAGKGYSSEAVSQAVKLADGEEDAEDDY